jgi:toxin HigB-1
VIVSFRDKQTQAIYHGAGGKAPQRRLPAALWSIARRKLDQLDTVGELELLAVPPGNRLEALSGDRRGQHSIRINDQYRICFTWTEAGPALVEIVDYH